MTPTFVLRAHSFDAAPQDPRAGPLDMPKACVSGSELTTVEPNLDLVDFRHLRPDHLNFDRSKVKFGQVHAEIDRARLTYGRTRPSLANLALKLAEGVPRLTEPARNKRSPYELRSSWKHVRESEA